MPVWQYRTGMQPRKRMRRIEHTHHVRYLTFSCNHRLGLFSNDLIKDLFAEHLAHARERFGFNLYAWVIMPEHVHLLLWPLLPDYPVSIALRELKRDFATQVIKRWRKLDAPILRRIQAPDGTTRFWLAGGGYDDNVDSIDEIANKIEYTHRNPVRRGLVDNPTDWVWSSARWYSGDHTSPVPIDPLPARRPTGPKRH